MGDKRMERGSAATVERQGLEVGDVVRRLGDLPGTAVFGVIANPASARRPVLAELSTAAALAELRRRLGVFAVRAFVPGDRPAAVLGEVALPLSPWDAPRAARLAGLVAFTASEVAPPIRRVMDDAAAAGCPIQTVVTDPEAPDPVVLGFRLFSPQALEDRLEYLRVAGLVPKQGQFVFLDVTGSGADSVRHVVTTLARGPHHSVVQARPDALPIDLLSMVAAADLVVTDSPVMLALALAQGRAGLGVALHDDSVWTPLVAVAPDRIVAGKAELAERLQSSGCQPVASGVSSLLLRNGDAVFDRLSEVFIDSGGSRLAEAVAWRIEDVVEERAALEVVNAGLRQRLAHEREAMAKYVRSVGDPVIGPSRLRVELARAHLEAEAHQAALHDALAEVERLRAEIAQIYSTRTMRAVRPARSLYARLRPRAR